MGRTQHTKVEKIYFEAITKEYIMFRNREPEAKGKTIKKEMKKKESWNDNEKEKEESEGKERERSKKIAEYPAIFFVFVEFICVDQNELESMNNSRKYVCVCVCKIDAKYTEGESEREKKFKFKIHLVFAVHFPRVEPKHRIVCVRNRKERTQQNGKQRRRVKTECSVVGTWMRALNEIDPLTAFFISCV